jgi:2-(1,2-epoxy-1,2-dihydrophenyl)acetyl-CoA isomerase
MQAGPGSHGSAVLCDIQDGIARITLNRPEVSNAINLEVAKELLAVSLRCEEAGVRVVLLSGAGRAFSVGGDLKTFAAQREKLPAYIRETTSYLHLATSRLARLDAPVIAAVHGPAAGGGFSLACSCDIVLAAESATFLMAYTKIGLVPDGSSSYFLPRIAGFKRAMELALTNRKLSAQEAREWGIVTQVVPDTELLRYANEMAAAFADGPTQAFGVTKRLLHNGWNESLETQMELESLEISAASGRADGREGIAAFLGKRAAKFRGK